MMLLKDFKSKANDLLVELNELIYKLPRKGKSEAECIETILEHAVDDVLGLIGKIKAIDLEDEAEELSHIDLFHEEDQWSDELRKVLDQHAIGETSYDACEKLKNALKPLGMTFNYYLGAEPYDLRPMHFLKSVKTLIDADSNCYPCKIDKTPHVEGEFSLRDTNFIRIWINLLSVEDLRYLRCYHEFTY